MMIEWTDLTLIRSKRYLLQLINYSLSVGTRGSLSERTLSFA